MRHEVRISSRDPALALGTHRDNAITEGNLGRSLIGHMQAFPSGRDTLKDDRKTLLAMEAISAS